MRESFLTLNALRQIQRKQMKQEPQPVAQVSQEVRSVWAKSKWRKPVVVSVGGWGRASRGN
jgi:hypothetical protein